MNRPIVEWNVSVTRVAGTGFVSTHRTASTGGL